MAKVSGLHRRVVLRAVETVPGAFGPRYQHSFTKLRIWEQTDFERLVHLDADTIVKRDIYWLFDWPEFSASQDVYQLFFSRTFNAGLFVADPKPETAAALMAALQRHPKYNTSTPFYDQVGIQQKCTMMHEVLMSNNAF
jgi:alpha-N-acetylglucosamine transferase